MKKVTILLVTCFFVLSLSSCAPSEYRKTMKTLDDYDGFSMVITGTHDYRVQTRLASVYVDNEAGILYFNGNTVESADYIIDISGWTTYGYRENVAGSSEYTRYKIKSGDVLSSNGGDVVLETTELCKGEWNIHNELSECDVDVIVGDLDEGFIDLLEGIELYPDNPDKFTITINATYNPETELIEEIIIDIKTLFISEFGRSPDWYDISKLIITFKELTDPNFTTPETYTESDEKLSLDDFFD